MALVFQDFTPRLMARARRGGPAQWEPVTAVVQRASQWLELAGMRAVNVETLLLPLAKSAQPLSSAAGSYERWDEDHQWVQVIRVWYEAQAPVVSPPSLGGSLPGGPVL